MRQELQVLVLEYFARAVSVEQVFEIFDNGCNAEKPQLLPDSGRGYSCAAFPRN